MTGRRSRLIALAVRSAILLAACGIGHAQTPTLIGTEAGHSVARAWNEALLNAIRNDYARPTVHARNLFHASIAMYDAWAAFDGAGGTLSARQDGRLATPVRSPEWPFPWTSRAPGKRRSAMPCTASSGNASGCLQEHASRSPESMRCSTISATTGRSLRRTTRPARRPRWATTSPGAYSNSDCEMDPMSGMAMRTDTTNRSIRP